MRELPICLPASAWVDHIPFLFLLFNLGRPRCFVELGVDLGASFLAACEAAQRLQCGTRSFGIDTWQGDQHAGHYQADVVFEPLQAFVAARYPGCVLVRQTFDQAAPRFPEGSIDLLHIDGLHTYEAAAHDFEIWRPKLSDRSVVLFHDTEVREWGFGVWRLWAELKTRYPSLEFKHSFGLGLLATGSSLPQSLDDLVTYAALPERLRELQHACLVAANEMPQRIQQNGTPNIPEIGLLRQLVMKRPTLVNP